MYAAGEWMFEHREAVPTPLGGGMIAHSPIRTAHLRPGPVAVCPTISVLKFTLGAFQNSAATKRGPMPSMRALNSMSTQPARAHSPPAQPLAAILLLSLAIPLTPHMLLPTSNFPIPPLHPHVPHPSCRAQPGSTRILKT